MADLKIVNNQVAYVNTSGGSVYTLPTTGIGIDQILEKGNSSTRAITVSDVTTTNVVANNISSQEMTVDSLTVNEPVLAHVVLTSDHTNRTEQNWQPMIWNTAVIDTKSGFDSSNNRYTIPVAGYYRIYAQTLLGVDGQQNNVRDTGICITRTRGATETQIAFSTHRHYNGSTDTSDVTENVYVIDNCQVGDYIKFYVYVNTDNSADFDIFEGVTAGGDNAHMTANIPGTGDGQGRSTYFTIERI